MGAPRPQPSLHPCTKRSTEVSYPCPCCGYLGLQASMQNLIRLPGEAGAWWLLEASLSPQETWFLRNHTGQESLGCEQRSALSPSSGGGAIGGSEAARQLDPSRPHVSLHLGSFSVIQVLGPHPGPSSENPRIWPQAPW